MSFLPSSSFLPPSLWAAMSRALMEPGGHTQQQGGCGQQGSCMSPPSGSENEVHPDPVQAHWGGWRPAPFLLYLPRPPGRGSLERKSCLRAPPFSLNPLLFGEGSSTSQC